MDHLHYRRLFVLIALLIALPVSAASPYLVKNINEGTAPTSSYPSHYTAFGALALFTTSNSYGDPQELWRSDGSEAGTYKLAEGGHQKAIWNGKVYFLPKGYGPTEIWSTDGTTAQKAMDLPPIEYPLGQTVLMPGPNHLYFVHGQKLYRTDGTTNGTTLVSNGAFNAGSSTVMGQALYFVAFPGSNPYQSALYRVDNSGVTKLLETTDGYFLSLMTVGNLVYFQRVTNGPYTSTLTLWRTDGTAAGTFMLKTGQAITLDTWQAKILVSGTNVYFTGSAGSGRKLWRSDGTLAGTVAIASTLPGSTATDFAAFPIGRLSNGTLLFRGAPLTANQSYGMWAFDGTNTTFLNHLPSGNQAFDAAVSNNWAVIGAGGELWRTDGTIGGTYSLPATGGSNGYVTWEMVAVGPKVFFGSTDYRGFELWRTDGFVAGTMLVEDINFSTFPSNPRNLRAFKNGALFTASGNATSTWSNEGIYDLWFSDGTEAGTIKIKEDVGWLDPMVPCGTRAFFGFTTPEAGHELWMTDGTAAGTVMVTDLYPGITNPDYGANSAGPSRLVCMDDRIYFTARTADRYSIWRSDGTAAGTLPVWDLGAPGSTNLTTTLYKNGHNLVFGARTYTGPNHWDGFHGLWRSDGTPGGTELIKNFGIFSVEKIVVAEPKVFAHTYYNGDIVLWASDMTTAGTTSFVEDEYFVGMLGTFDGRLVFQWPGYLTPSKGYCISDGTVAGTTCFDPELSNSGGWDLGMWPLNGRLYYNKPNLYSTDGITSADTGAAEVENFLANAGGRLYIAGAKGSGWGITNLVETDGTPNGTITLMAGNEPREAVGSGGRLFIAADELYAYDLEVTPTSFAPTTVAAPGGQTITISGRGFTSPVTVKVGLSDAVVGTVTPTSIQFVAPPHEPGAYDIHLTLGDDREITLEQPLLYSCTAPVAAVGATPAAVCPLVPVTLSGSGATRCEWFPGTGLDDPSSCTPTVTVDKTSTYSLIVFNAEGCPSANYPSVTVTVNPLPAPQITVSGPSQFGYMLPNTVYTATTPDEGAGATYAWSGTGITITAGANERTVTFKTGCGPSSIQVVATNATACSKTAKRDLWLTWARITSFTPGVAAPGMTITVNGSGFLCASALQLSSDNGTNKSVAFTIIDDTKLRFTYPVDAYIPARLRVTSGGESSLSQFNLYRSPNKDFGRDGSSDLFWWNSTTGETSVWFMGSYSFSGERSLTVPTNWSPAVFGDFNGDLNADAFWRNPTTGETSIWLMNRAGVTTSVRSFTVPTTWLPMGTGDFDANGKSDIFWHNAATGETSIWFMNGTAATTLRSLTAPAGYKPAVFGDFNADGKTDVFWRNQSAGKTLFWLMNGLNPSTTTAGLDLASSWIVAGGGDFNADARTDVLWRNTTTGDNAMWFMSGTSAGGGMSQRKPLEFTVASVGDFSRDGRADIFWHNRTTGETESWLMNAASVSYLSKFLQVDPKWRPVY